ncbi:unnamed protein product [Ixodes pacificus]
MGENSGKHLKNDLVCRTKNKTFLKQDIPHVDGVDDRRTDTTLPRAQERARPAEHHATSAHENAGVCARLVTRREGNICGGAGNDMPPLSILILDVQI